MRSVWGCPEALGPGHGEKPLGKGPLGDLEGQGIPPAEPQWGAGEPLPRAIDFFES